MKLNWFQLTMLFAIALIVFRNCYFSKKQIVGTYTSNAVHAVGEMPRFGEKVTFYEDGTYRSEIWGVGTYEIRGSEIRLTNGYVGAGLPLAREFNIGTPLMVLNADREYYLIKD